jgi:RNA polymerase sigma-70 factor (ECF subfamily)
MVGQCLADMPLLYSEPLSLYFIEEKSYQEISDILKIPMGTVAVRINRGKQIMKKLCKKI